MPGLGAVEAAFARHLQEDPTHSAQLAVHLRGELVLDLAGGPGLQADSLLPVFSSSKGATAVVVALLVERGLLDLDARVASYWPEFAQAGKQDVTVRQLLSHQAGLVGVDGGFLLEDLFEHAKLAERLAAQRPYWLPGQAFLYHGLTIGVLADELVRRTDGRTVAEVLTQDVTGPRGIDLWMGTTEEQEPRVAPFALPDLEDVLAFHAAAGPQSEPDGIASLMMPIGGAMALLPRVNDLDFRQAGVPAGGVLASARGLASLYACLRHEVNGPRLLSEETIAQVSQTQVWGTELDTGFQTRFGIIFQVPVSPRWPWGSTHAFGHDGAGGSLAFCDPVHDLAFGFTVQRMPLPEGVDRRALELASLVRGCLRG